MRQFILYFLCCIAANTSFAQHEGHTWMFGYCNAINFNNGAPEYGGVSGTGVYLQSNQSFNRSNNVCDAEGNLLFYVKIDDDPTLTLNRIFDANGQAMDNSNIAIAYPVRGPIQIIKRPGAGAIYYVIYSLNYALFSTTVDMSLNNGLGGVVPEEKNVMLSGWQTVVGEKTTVVQGCDGIWLVVRSRTASEYLSFKVTEAGIDPAPVVSVCGLLPLNRYNSGTPGPPGGRTPKDVIGWAGLLKASPDGTKIVACCEGTLELYQFSKCSGKLSQPVLLDTVSTYTIVHNTMGCYGYNKFIPDVPVSYYSACFSPDNSKLYATYYYGRQVFQFDLGVANPENIISTKTAVLANQPTIIYCPGGDCGFVDTTAIGDLKLGPDGKIYIGNNAYPPCLVDTTYTLNHALHAINNPNQPGMACNPQLNAFVFGSVFEGKYRTGQNFNPDIVLAPPPRDTVTAYEIVSLCSGNLLQADTPGSCYMWNTGAAESSIIIDTPGLYVVNWSAPDCSYRIDSFLAWMPPMPEVNVNSPACPEELAIEVRNREGDTTKYHYLLEGNSHSESFYGNSGYNFVLLEPGNYSLHINTDGSCDSLMAISLEAYEVPRIITQPVDTIIRYGDSVRIAASGAYLYHWWPSSPLDTATLAAPIARPKEPTLFSVLGMNEHGCRDTAYVNVDIDYNLHDLIPNAFSPNGDGLNDVFRIAGITYQKLGVFKVFNRYGEEVFSTMDPLAGWDGTYKGSYCDVGTYYYYAELIYPDGRLKQLKGDVLLMR